MGNELIDIMKCINKIADLLEMIAIRIGQLNERVNELEESLNDKE